MNYQVIIDMTLVLPRIKNLGLKLGIFQKDSVVLTLEADNPDDACYFAYKTFCDYIIEQSSTFETKNLLKELKNEFVVVGLRLL